MVNFSYYILVAISKFLGLLPFFMVYLLSNALAFFAHRVVGYRRKVVRINLERSFPQKSIGEIKKIEKDFYRYFCDYFLETLMLLSISKERMLKRFRFTNPEILDSYFNNKKSIIMVAGHYGSFEMSYVMPLYFKHKILGVYKPQTNKGVDAFYIKTRERYGVEAVPINNIGRKLFQYINAEQPTITYLLTDQRPLRMNIRYWTTFLNQDTPVFLGPEKFSVKFDLPVFFIDYKRVSRGNYEATIVLLEDNPKNTCEFDITEKHTNYLEGMIKRDPAIWFWAHRRWGHQKLD